MDTQYKYVYFIYQMYKVYIIINKMGEEIFVFIYFLVKV